MINSPTHFFNAFLELTFLLEIILHESRFFSHGFLRNYATGMYNLRPSPEGCTHQEISLSLRAEPFSIIICENLSCRPTISLYHHQLQEHFSKNRILLRRKMESRISWVPRIVLLYVLNSDEDVGWRSHSLSWWMPASQPHSTCAFSSCLFLRPASTI